MTDQEIDDLVKNVVAQLNTGADLAAAINPTLVPFILLGKAVSALIPGLAVDIARWIDGNPPTPQELEDFRKKLEVLADPDLP